MPIINQFYEKFRRFFADHWPKAYNFCDSRKYLVKFIIAGCFSGGADLIFLFILHGFLKWNIVLASSIAFILSFLISFTLQKFWTFRNYSQDKMVGQLFLYILNAFIGLNLNGFFMHLLVNKYFVWYMLAQIIVNLAIGFWNFLVYKFVVFRKNEINC